MKIALIFPGSNFIFPVSLLYTSRCQKAGANPNRREGECWCASGG